MKIDTLTRLPRWLAKPFESLIRRVPSLRRMAESEYDKMLGGLEEQVHPYRGVFSGFTALPEEGCTREEILTELEQIQTQEQERWQSGHVSGAVYHGGSEHIEFLNRVYGLYSQSNPLHADIWPSASKFEAEIISMTARMLGAPEDGQVCGSVSSGGTESIMLAVKTYREWARDVKGIRHPEMVVPVTAHAAFEKASDLFGIRMRVIPVDESFRARVDAASKAINHNTVMVVGSAPSFPHGAIDPIPELSELARRHKTGFHVDACLGGFLLPWAKKLGYPVPAFDFSLPGVTSMSADTHKYGYAPKGSSVVLYRTPELRRYQYFTYSDWPGGLYFSPTFAGSRPGALSAGCWAAMVTTGENGYTEAARRILETAAVIKDGIRQIPGLELMGDPLWVIAFRSSELDIYRLLDSMTARGWSLNGLHRPSGVHLCVTLPHTQAGVAQQFLDDLQEAVTSVRSQPAGEGGMAPVYGLAGSLPMRGMVKELLKRYIDVLYKV